VPASTVTQTNTFGLPVTVYIAGGTVTNVTLSGVATGLTGGPFRLMPGETGVINSAAVLTQAKNAGFDGPVTPWADRSTLAGRGRERIVKVAGDRLEAVWREAGLPIVPRWFTPVAKDAFGRPLNEEVFMGAE
jgi:hypothetical protein